MYQILGVSTFALFQAGKILKQRVGAQSKAQQVQMLSTAL
jgi:hypothetical protein